MSTSYYVRELQREDATYITHLAMKAWKYTYKEIFTEEFIETYVTRSYRSEVIERIVDQVKQGFTKFYVLLERRSEKIWGFAQVGYEKYWETGQKNLPLQLFRIYLDPEMIGMGLGKMLLEKVEQFVKVEKQDSYIVGVHERNAIGRRFYEKNSFKAITKISDAEGEIYLEKNL